MTIPAVNSAEELVATLQMLFEERRFDDCLVLAELAEQRFPDKALARHAAGLAWERTWLEHSAEGNSPPLDHYQRAAVNYRAAMELDEANRSLHAERLFACVFILGTQRSEETCLREALALVDGLAMEREEGADRTALLREGAVAASGLARVTRAEEDWAAAEARFDALEEPEPGREHFFFHYYRGIVKREAGQRRGDESLFRDAADSFRRAAAQESNAAIAYLLADCLLQLGDASDLELREIRDLIADLRQRNPDDGLVAALDRRMAVRVKLSGEGQ